MIRNLLAALILAVLIAPSASGPDFSDYVDDEGVSRPRTR
jgi:hypothetical protein